MVTTADRLTEPQYLSTAAAADLLQISADALLCRRSRGYAPPAIRAGRALLWSRAEIDKWLAERASGVPFARPVRDLHDEVADILRRLEAIESRLADVEGTK